jgi:hypothetical protein
MSNVDTPPRLLSVLVAPSAEIAYAWAMRLLTQLGRTGAAPQREVTPWATLHGTSPRYWPHAEGHGAWQ